MLPSLVVPSIASINYGLFKFLANHPLLIEPLVIHPITKEPVLISSYRFMDGFPLDEGLVCSIFPAAVPSDDHSPSPTTTSASVLYKPYELGHSHEEAMYHYIVKFIYKEVLIDGQEVSTDTNLITVPTRALVNPNDRLLLSPATREVELILNPPMDIVSSFMELTRLAIYDIKHNQDFPLQVNSAEVIHQNYGTASWNTKTNLLLHQGHLYLRLNCYLAKGWKDKFVLPLEEINIDLSRSKQIKC